MASDAEKSSSFPPGSYHPSDWCSSLHTTREEMESAITELQNLQPAGEIQWRSRSTNVIGITNPFVLDLRPSP